MSDSVMFRVQVRVGVMVRVGVKVRTARLTGRLQISDNHE